MPDPEHPSAAQEKPPAEQSVTAAEPPTESGDQRSQGGDFAKMLKSINYMGMGKQRILFIQSLALMLNAGLPLVDALKTQVIETRSRPLKKLLTRIIENVENGVHLWRAMDREGFFTPFEIALVRIGEEAGTLARNMEYLAEQEEKDRALKQKVKMAMIYPSIVLTLMFIIVMGLGLFVLPNLVQVLYSLKVELPLTTRIVIKIAETFEAHGTVFIPLIIATVLLMLLAAKFTRFRSVAQWAVLRTPGIGALAREATIAHFGVVLGGLLRAGVPLLESLSSLVEVTHMTAYAALYRRILDHVAAGDSFAKSFEAIGSSRKLLPVSVEQLIVTGEKSGALSDVLLKIATIYDRKASETAEKLPVVLEPLLLLFIGALVGTIAFAIIVPIYSVVGNIGR